MLQKRTITLKAHFKSLAMVFTSLLDSGVQFSMQYICDALP